MIVVKNEDKEQLLPGLESGALPTVLLFPLLGLPVELEARFLDVSNLMKVIAWMSLWREVI